MSAGTQQVLINPELTAKPGHPLGGIRQSKEFQHTYPQIRLNTLTGTLVRDAGLKGWNCSSFTWWTVALFFSKLCFSQNNMNGLIFYSISVTQMRKCHWSEALIEEKRIFMSCLTHSKFPLLKRLPDGGWISCMFVNIICSPLHPRGTRQSLKVSDSNANICLATEAEWDRVGHLHQRYSLVDRIHKMEF